LKRRNFIKYVSAALGSTLFGGVVYGTKSSEIEITRSKVTTKGSYNKLKIVGLSDIHAPRYPGSGGALVHIVNLEMPDIFILAGDVVDKTGNENLVREFSTIKATKAKIAVLGNWEYLSQLNIGRLKEEYEKAGFVLLVNEKVKTNSITIMGVDDLVEGTVDWQLLDKEIEHKQQVLLISHCPQVFDHIKASSKAPIIMIAGHTHGGQIAPFGITLITPKGSGAYVKGWYHHNQNSMYVMRGIGTTPGIPFRIGSRPEIFVLDLVGRDG
jgi:predicted MPP superfamily phosphohydrolase